MKKTKTVLVAKFIVAFALLALLASCASTKYESFTKGSPGWTDIMVHENVSQTTLLNRCVEIIAREGYEPDMISKDTGYMRTKWKNVVTVAKRKNSEERSDYRMRIIVQASSDGSKVGLQCAAQQLLDGRWVDGADSAELEKIAEMIRGSVGGY